MQRQSFLFRKEWCDAASGLRPNLRQEFLEAVISYGLTGEVPQGLGEAVRFAFGIAKAVIDRDNEELAKHEVAIDNSDAVVDKQQHISDVRREAGKKSGEARRNKSVEQKGTKRTNVQFVQFVHNEQNPLSHTSIDNINNQDNINNKKIEDKKESEEKETKKKPTADSNVNSTADGHKGRALQEVDSLRNLIGAVCRTLSTVLTSRLKQENNSPSPMLVLAVAFALRFARGEITRS